MFIKNKLSILAAISLLAVPLLCGCQTAKGAATGVGATVVCTAQGATQDSQNFWHTVLKADDWMRKNLW